MTRNITLVWGAAVIAVALLNIVDVLPDWATFTAILTWPIVARASGNCCCLPLSQRVEP